MMPTIDPCVELNWQRKWWCCLHTIEKTMMQSLIAIRVGGLIEFVLKSNFDAAWNILDPHVGGARYVAFVAVYHLRLATVDIDGEEVEVYFMDDEWWFEWILYVGGCPQYHCDGGCFIQEYGK